MLFDPIRVHQISGKNTLLRLRNTEYDENRPMGNVAMMQLDPVVELWLIGLRDETHDILIKLHSWIEDAINRKEDFGDSYNFHHMNLHRAAAMCFWLRSGVENTDHWNQARLLNAKISLHDNDYDQKGFSTLRLDEYMAYASLAGHYEAGIVEYQKYHKLISVKSGMLKPRDFGYASCLFHYRSEFDESELFNSGRRMLGTYMQERWLGAGQFVRAIMWLKMVYKYSGEAPLSPLQTVLKAYENMPEVSKPSFLVNYQPD